MAIDPVLWWQKNRASDCLSITGSSSTNVCI